MRRLALAVLGVPSVAVAVAIVAAIAGAGAQACTGTQPEPVGGVPPQLVPLFQGAASKYDLGSEGAAILAAINYEESRFDSNEPGVRSGANSAGAAGPMQIGIGGTAGDTWDTVKVNAPGDPPGRPPNVYDEADAVYSAAHYLALSGLTANPGTWHNAIWAYNHADWYVTAVLERAQAYYAQGLRTSDSGAVFVSSPSPMSCPVTSAGGYVNPFARVPPGHLVAERIDMGVDYADNSPDPILAIGDATISYAGPDPGWENGYSVNYELVDGPYQGHYIYVAESVTPTVHTGQHVIAGAQIAAFAEPNVHGLETGWAAGPGRPVANAAVLGQQAQAGDPGGNLTWCGNNMSELLAHSGAPPGLSEGRPVVGSSC
jgi:murein DD-endopeptidase MepM/ murein hydrolase activator NlpD